jgi:peptidoglycan/LPS O-acetylase OafA/YrhL
MSANPASAMFDRMRGALAPALSDPQSGRITYLDGWRAVAVGLVVMAHTLSVYGIKILQFGTLGVYLFFGISGYIITRLLLVEQHKTGRIDIRAFYVRRVARILPPFLIFVLAMLLITPVDGIGWQAARSISFTCNMGFQGGCIRIFEHTWSLAFEEQFYLVYPLLLAGIWRWWLLPLVALWLMPFFVPVPFIGHGGFARIVLIMTMGAAYAAFETRLSAWFARIPTIALLVMPLILFGWAAWEQSALQKVLGVLLPFATILTLFALPTRLSGLRRVLSFAVLNRIGLYSYTFYLWQQFFSYPWSWNTGVMPVVGIAVGLGIAALSYHTLEQTCRNWARDFNARHKRAATPGAAKNAMSEAG